MRRLAFVLLAILLLVPAALAQESVAPIPRYSFAYSVTGNELRVTTLLDNEEWVQTTMPARVLFGRVDFGLVQPQWSADGRSLYMTIYEPESDTLAVTIGAFDVTTRQFRRIAQVVDPTSTAVEYVRIEALSPDNRYAWVSRLMTQETYLVDLIGGKVVTQSACPARVLEWLSNEVLLACTGASFAQPNLFTLNVANGQAGRSLQAPALDNSNLYAAYVTGGLRLKDDRLLVGAFGSALPTEIGLVGWADTTANYLARGTHLSVSADQQYAAFFAEGRIMRLDVASGQVADLGAAEVIGIPMWQGNTLQFWQTRDRNGNFEIWRITVTAQTRREHILYSGARPAQWTVSPDSGVVAVSFGDNTQSYIEIYDEEGLLWVSDFAYPSSYIQLQADYQLAWTQDGDWLHLRYAPTPAEMPRTLSVNVRNRKTILAPEPRAIFMGESQDQAWWMYEVGESVLDTPINRLLVYHPATNATRLITEAVPLYADFQYPAWNYYLWSPTVR